jgi:hypothetical protein
MIQQCMFDEVHSASAASLRGELHDPSVLHARDCW